MGDYYDSMRSANNFWVWELDETLLSEWKEPLLILTALKLR